MNAEDQRRIIETLWSEAVARIEGSDNMGEPVEAMDAWAEFQELLKSADVDLALHERSTRSELAHDPRRLMRWSPTARGRRA